MRRLLFLTLTVSVISIAGCGDDSKPTSPKSSIPEVAYLHRPILGNQHAKEFETYLDTVGYPTTLVSVDTVDAVDWSRFDAVIIDDRLDDHFLSGLTTAMEAVHGSRLPVLGIGISGFNYFSITDTSNGVVNGGATYHDSLSSDPAATTMVVANANTYASDAVFRLPTKITLTNDSTLVIQPRGYHTFMFSGTQIHDSIVCIGKAPGGGSNFSVVRVGGKGYFFGYGGSIELMTTGGRFLITNILFDLTH